MRPQQRWFCDDCHREWLQPAEDQLSGELVKWTPELGCLGCHGPNIGLVDYVPQFPGGDIPRPDTPPLTAAQQRVIDAEPPQTPMPAFGLLAHLEQNTELTDREQKNLTLALSSPEFG